AHPDFRGGLSLYGIAPHLTNPDSQRLHESAAIPRHFELPGPPSSPHPWNGTHHGVPSLDRGYPSGPNFVHSSKCPQLADQRQTGMFPPEPLQYIVLCRFYFYIPARPEVHRPYENLI